MGHGGDPAYVSHSRADVGQHALPAGQGEVLKCRKKVTETSLHSLLSEKLSFKDFRCPTKSSFYKRCT